MNRKSFLKASTLSTLGYTGMAMSGLAMNPNKAFSRPSDLKITDIRGTVIAANYDYPIIKVYTNQDIVGLGEVRDAGWISQALMLKPYLIGKNPLDIEAILASIRHLTGDGRYGGGYSAVDIALMDIAGKALGYPCWKLLGNKYRDRIDVYADTADTNNKEAYAAMMKRRLDKGYRHYKMDLRQSLFEGTEGANVQVGDSPFQTLPTQKGLEIWGEYVQNVRDVIGYDVTLGADHFGYQTADSGIALGEFMAGSKYSLAYIEDVVHFRRFNSVNINKKLTAESPTPTLGFEDLFGMEGFAPFIEQKAVNIIHPDMLTSGGMIETKKIADYADRFGIKTMMHCAGSPIGTMAMVHMCAVIREFISLENHALEIPWWGDLVTGVPEGVIEQGGYIEVPDTPGLGIELNEEVAQKHRREAEYLTEYNPGFFDETPEFDQPMMMAEAREKGLIGGYHVEGPWWHINSEGEYANQISRDQR